MMGILEETIKNKNDDNEHVKKLLAIRKLDAFNYMQTNNTLHKDNVRLASDISILSYEVEKGFSRIKDHLQVFRPTILELDNQNIQQRQSIQHDDLTETYQEKEILSQFNFQLTRISNVFQKVQEWLLSNYQKTRLPAKLINVLNNMEQNKLNLMIYSAILLVINYYYYIKDQLKRFDERTIKNNVLIQSEKISKKISLVGRK
ncbi:hypothetical protein ABPG73_017081 [Tetrahymena malaccensis]